MSEKSKITVGEASGEEANEAVARSEKLPVGDDYKPKSRPVLSDTHPVVNHLKNRRTMWQTALASDEEKEANIEAINEALQVLTNDI